MINPAMNIFGLIVQSKDALRSAEPIQAFENQELSHNITEFKGANQIIQDE